MKKLFQERKPLPERSNKSKIRFLSVYYLKMSTLL